MSLPKLIFCTFKLCEKFTLKATVIHPQECKLSLESLKPVTFPVR